MVVIVNHFYHYDTPEGNLSKCPINCLLRKHEEGKCIIRGEGVRDQTKIPREMEESKWTCYGYGIRYWMYLRGTAMWQLKMGRQMYESLSVYGLWWCMGPSVEIGR